MKYVCKAVNTDKTIKTLRSELHWGQAAAGTFLKNIQFYSCSGALQILSSPSHGSYFVIIESIIAEFWLTHLSVGSWPSCSKTLLLIVPNFDYVSYLLKFYWKIALNTNIHQHDINISLSSFLYFSLFIILVNCKTITQFQSIFTTFSQDIAFIPCLNLATSLHKSVYLTKNFRA